MNTVKQTISLFALTIPIFLLATACGDVSSPATNATKPLAVKMQVASGTATAATSASQSATTQALDSLTQVKLLVDRLELENELDEDNDEHGNHQDSVEFEVNDLVVDLPLDGSAVVLSTTDVPEGTYNKFKMEVDGPDEESDVDDEDLAGSPSDTTRNSVVVKGFYNGTPFTYKSQVEFELEMELNPPLVVSATSPSVAVKVLVDPFSWFKDPATGAGLDPNDPSNREQIDQNIKNSLNAEDDHGDQDDDQGENDDDDGDD